MTSTTPALNQSGQTMGSKGLRTRRKLIDTTVALLVSIPLRDLRVVDIASTAKTSAPTFYVYFDSVIDAVLAATAELSQSTGELLELARAEWTEGNSHDRAAELVAAYVRFWDEHRALLRTRNLAAEEGDERFIHTREDAIRPLLHAMVEKIALAQREGRIARSVHPYASAGTLLMMMERLGALAHIYHDRDGAVTFPQMAEAVAHAIAAAFGWPVRDDPET